MPNPYNPFLETPQPADFLMGGYEEHSTDSVVQSAYDSRNAHLIGINAPRRGPNGEHIPVTPVIFFLDWKEWEEVSGFKEPGATRVPPLESHPYADPAVFEGDYRTLKRVLGYSNDPHGNGYPDIVWGNKGYYRPNWSFLLVLPWGRMAHDSGPLHDPTWFVEGGDFGRAAPLGVAIPVPVLYLPPGPAMQSNGTLTDGSARTRLKDVGGTYLARDHTLPTYSIEQLNRLIPPHVGVAVQELNAGTGGPRKNIHVGGWGWVDSEYMWEGRDFFDIGKYSNQGRMFQLFQDVNLEMAERPPIVHRAFAQWRDDVSIRNNGEINLDLWAHRVDDGSTSADPDGDYVSGRYLKWYARVIWRLLSRLWPGIYSPYIAWDPIP